MQNKIGVSFAVMYETIKNKTTKRVSPMIHCDQPLLNLILTKMKSKLRLTELVSSGDLYMIEDKISDLKYSIAACCDVIASNGKQVIEKMQYQLAVLEDVKNRILKNAR